MIDVRVQKDSENFMELAIEISISLQLVTNGPPKNHQTLQKRNTDGTQRHKNDNGENANAQDKSPDNNAWIDEQDDLIKNKTAVCLYPFY